METEREVNSRHSMLDFKLLMAVPSAGYYLSTKDKYKTFYVRPSCFPQCTIDKPFENITTNI